MHKLNKNARVNPRIGEHLQNIAPAVGYINVNRRFKMAAPAAVSFVLFRYLRGFADAIVTGDCQSYGCFNSF